MLRTCDRVGLGCQGASTRLIPRMFIPEESAFGFLCSKDWKVLHSKRGNIVDVDELRNVCTVQQFSMATHEQPEQFPPVRLRSGMNFHTREVDTL